MLYWLLAAFALCLLSEQATAVAIGYPAVALCTKPSTIPFYNCTFRSSFDSPFEPCGSPQSVRISVAGRSPAPCALFNFDSVIYGTDSYSVAMFTSLGLNATDSVVLFYSLPANWNSSIIEVDALDGITPHDKGVTLVRIIGRDTENGRYSVVLDRLSVDGAEPQLWLTIDPLYFEKIRAALKNYYWCVLCSTRWELSFALSRVRKRALLILRPLGS